jgi:hypothetical protein
MSNPVVRNMVCIGGAALAASVLAPSTAKAQGFEGLYGGISYGTNRGYVNQDWTDYAYSGGSGGLFVGYNAAVGDWIVGSELGLTRSAEADYDWYMVGLSDIIDLRLRAGRAFGNTLVYGAVGYSQARAGKIGFTFDNRVSGASVGVGFEVNLARNVFVGGDVTRRNFSRSTGGGDFNNGVLTTATVRAGFRF